MNSGSWEDAAEGLKIELKKTCEERDQFFTLADAGRKHLEVARADLAAARASVAALREALGALVTATWGLGPTQPPSSWTGLAKIHDRAQRAVADTVAAAEAWRSQVRSECRAETLKMANMLRDAVETVEAQEARCREEGRRAGLEEALRACKKADGRLGIFGQPYLTCDELSALAKVAP